MLKKIGPKTDPCGTPFRKSRPRAKNAAMGGEGGTCVDSRVGGGGGMRGRGLVRGIAAGSLGLSKSSGKTSYTIPHSFSNSFSMTEDAEVGDMPQVKSQRFMSSISLLVLTSKISSVTFFIVEGS